MVQKSGEPPGMYKTLNKGRLTISLPYQLVSRISEPSTVRYIGISLSAWWFLILKNMLVKLGSFPQCRDENKTNI